MFESVFNLKFNLNKAYTDIGLKDDDAGMNSLIYGFTPGEYAEALRNFESTNRRGAEAVLKDFGTLKADPNISAKIAYIGDSITSDRESHMNIVRMILKEYHGIDIHDFAISGYKASDVFTSYYPWIADYAPHIAVIMIGTNDMRITDDKYGYYHSDISEYSRNINYILENLRGAGCRTIICTLPPFDMEKIRAALNGWMIKYSEEARTLYDGCIVEAAERHDAILVDMRAHYAAYKVSDITLADGLHLNAEGQTLLAKQIFPKLAALLNIRAANKTGG